MTEPLILAVLTQGFGVLGYLVGYWMGNYAGVRTAREACAAIAEETAPTVAEAIRARALRAGSWHA